MKREPKKSSTQDIPPLLTEEHVEIDQTTGGEVIVQRNTRGLLGFERRTYRHFSQAIFETPSARKNLEEFCDYLRCCIEARLVSSVDPNAQAEKIDDDLFRAAPGRWMAKVRKATKILTVERAALDLLFWTRTILLQNKSAENLDLIVRFAAAYADYRILRSYNTPAYHAQRARRGRQEGPPARRNKAAESCRIARELAEQYWQSHPHLRNLSTPTAEEITMAVNDALRQKGLLPRGKEKFTTATVANYLRKKAG